MPADPHTPSLPEQLAQLMQEAERTSVWAPSPVSKQPEIVLSLWTVYAVKGALHLVGYCETERSGRVSSTVVAYDEATHVAVSRSGRVFRLLGAASEFPDRDGAYVFDRWLELQQLSRHDVVAGSLQGLPAVHPETLEGIVARQERRAAAQEQAAQRERDRAEAQARGEKTLDEDRLDTGF
jgi:hypothetical protein